MLADVGKMFLLEERQAKVTTDFLKTRTKKGRSLDCEDT